MTILKTFASTIAIILGHELITRLSYTH